MSMSSSDQSPGGQGPQALAIKQAACLNCRKSKVKCRKTAGATACDRCALAGVQCEIPSFHAGRQKGVKNKRTGLDKAIHQIEEAIKRSRNDTSADPADASQLQRLLDAATSTLPSVDEDVLQPPIGTARIQNQSVQSMDEPLALDDAENPLQLLARASDLRVPSPPSTTLHASTPSIQNLGEETEDVSNVNRFFLPMKASLDVDRAGNTDGLDPINVGLVTEEEAETLIAYFYENLAHTRWGLDPLLHNLSFIRSRSAFLFTSVLAASALFIPTGAALAKRLEIHRDSLAHQVIAKRLRSVEIVLALLVNVPWMHPGAHSADDNTGLYISIALSIALDLSLNKIVIPSLAFDRDTLNRVPKSDCIDAKKALAMDGFENIPPDSEWGQRLLLRRERAWIALFVLERGVCLARGRSYSVPVTPLLQHCDRWHAVQLSDVRDPSMLSMAVLRRDLEDLFSAVRLRCDSYRVIDVGAKVAQEIEASVNTFFDNWHATWTAAIREDQLRSLPPYVEILVTHTRLSTYCGVLNHPTAPFEVKRLFRASALSSALNVMRAAIQGEKRLKSMPNNTVIMICFAACVALKLSTPSPHESLRLAPSVRSLIEETAAVLERIGSTPYHRNGASVLYGKYLREILKQAPTNPQSYGSDIRPSGMLTSFIEGTSISAPADPTMQQTQFPPADNWIEPWQFSAMSDNEIIETVLNAGPELDNTMIPDFASQPQDGNFMWLSWMDPPEFGF